MGDCQRPSTARFRPCSERDVSTWEMVCRDAPGVGHYEMTPTPESSPVRELEKGRDSISLDVTSRGMGRPFTYSVQFVAPCLVRYYMPGVCCCHALPSVHRNE